MNLESLYAPEAGCWKNVITGEVRYQSPRLGELDWIKLIRD